MARPMERDSFSRSSHADSANDPRDHGRETVGSDRLDDVCVIACRQCAVVRIGAAVAGQRDRGHPRSAALALHLAQLADQLITILPRQPQIAHEQVDTEEAPKC